MNKPSKSFYISWGVGVIASLTGLLLMAIGAVGYGVTIFCVLPIALGISTGFLPDRQWAKWGLIVSLVIFVILLIAGALEGFVCVLMAIPIITPFIFLGYLIAGIIKNRKAENSNSIDANGFLIPFLILFLSTGLEFYWGDSNIREEVRLSMVVPFSPEEVYDQIIDVDTVAVTPHLLHKIGLPLPTKCELSEEKIGGIRNCVFQDGTIVETIKDFERGKYLKMDVSAFNLKGRAWLSFDEDLYEMETVEGGTQITRTTSYFSSLKPRFYWKQAEAYTIWAEQDLVFRNLKNDLVLKQVQDDDLKQF